MKKLLITTAIITGLVSGCETPQDKTSVAQPVPVTTDYITGAWSKEQTAPLLDKTLRLTFEYDDSQLTRNEKAAVKLLLAAGERLHTLYLDQIHPQGRDVERAMASLEGREDLQSLYLSLIHI